MLIQHSLSVIVPRELCMSENIVLYHCNHCSGSGTCSNGANGNSCVVCVKRRQGMGEIPRYWGFQRKRYLESFTGLACGCCGGIGKAEIMTARINGRITSVLGIIMPFFLILLTFLSSASGNTRLFDVFSTLACSVTGTVIGYYFSSCKNSS